MSRSGLGFELGSAVQYMAKLQYGGKEIRIAGFVLRARNEDSSQHAYMSFFPA